MNDYVLGEVFLWLVLGEYSNSGKCVLWFAFDVD